MTDELGQDLVERLLRRKAQLLRFIERRVGTRADAEDLLQAALLRVVAKQRTLRRADSVVPWFYRILQDLIVDYRAPVEGFDVLIYTGSGLMGREITSIRSCDIVVIAGGRTGTLGELAIAYDEGRLIGVLTGTGGITTMVEEIIRVCRKDTGACVLYDDDPTRLVDQLIEYYRTIHFRKPSCFCDARADGT